MSHATKAERDREVERIKATSKRQRAYQSLEAEWATRKAQWVESVWLAYMRGEPGRARYLYVQRATTGSGWGLLITALEGDDPPAGCELACNERIPPGSKAEIMHWLNKFSGRLPVMPTEDL